MERQAPNQHSSAGDTNVTDTTNGLQASGPASSVFVSEKPSGRRKKTLIGAAIAGVLVVGVAGYTFGYYLPNRPAHVYSRALSNTSAGYDKLVDYAANKEVAKAYEAAETKGTIKVSGSGAGGDGSFSAKNDAQGNATFTADFGMQGVRVSLEGMAKDAENSGAPDLYLKAKGLESLSSLVGSDLSAFEDTWFSLDHTFFDAQAQQLSSLGMGASIKPPTQEQMIDAAKKIGDVNKRYLFSDDKSRAVFQMQKYKGEEVAEGKDTKRFTVKTRKDHLKKYVDELGKALDKSSLNQWAQDTIKEDLSNVIDTWGGKDRIDEIESETFDVWVNTKTKLIHKFRIQAEKDAYTDIGLNFDGGSEYPFFIKTKSGQISAAFSLTLNTKTNSFKLHVERTASGETGLNMKLDMQVKPFSGKVEVTPPAGATPLIEAVMGFTGGATARDGADMSLMKPQSSISVQ